MDPWYLAIALLAAFGLALCAHIYREKRAPKPMVCPMGANCDAVLHSSFSTFAGVPLEVLGAAYYALSLVAYGALAFWQPDPFPVELRFALLAVGALAFLFSCYLTFVQAFYVKSWCTWCLTSAGTTTVMFALTAVAGVAAGADFVPLLASWRDAITAAHLAGFAIGIGGATIADLVFFRFMRDFHVSDAERGIIKILNQVLWLGLGVVVLSAVGLYLPAHAGAPVPFFWPEMAVLAVIAGNGAFLNLVVMPRLCDAAKDVKVLRVAEVAGLRRFAFASAAVSFVSWYAAFLAVVLAETGKLAPASFFLWYVTAVVIALVGSQVLESRFYAAPQAA